MTEDIKLPTDVLAYHDSTFTDVCEYLEEAGHVDDANKVIRLSIEATANDMVVVTAVAELPEFDEQLVNDTESILSLDPGDEVGIFILSDPRPHPEQNKALIGEIKPVKRAKSKLVNQTNQTITLKPDESTGANMKTERIMGDQPTEIRIKSHAQR